MSDWTRRILAAQVSILALALALALAGCSPGPDEGTTEEVDPSQGDPEPDFEPIANSVFLNVRDGDGQPIAGASVKLHSLPDDVVRLAWSTTSDHEGYLLLEGLPEGRLNAEISAPGYTSSNVVLELRPGAHVGVPVYLHALGEPMPFVAQEGASVERGGVRVEIPGGALVDSSGQPVTGLVEATIVPFDPSTQELRAAPGPLEGIDRAGERVSLQTFFMAEISVWQNGSRLQLAPGANAVLEMELPRELVDAESVPETIASWWFDHELGMWVQTEAGDGVGLVTPNGEGGYRWTVSIDHFSHHNCDLPWYGKACYSVTIKDSTGNVVPDVEVEAEGIKCKYWSSTLFTDEDGHVCVEVKQGVGGKITIGDQLEIPLDGNHPTSSCDGQGAACKELVVELPDGMICTPGAYRACDELYPGPAGTENVGVCQGARSYCNLTGTGWLPCGDARTPGVEVCGNGVDEDCDGLVDEEGAQCICSPGQVASCYSGPAQTLGVGTCEPGHRVCNAEGTGFGPCLDERVPAAEVCDNTCVDADCNGSGFCSGHAFWAESAQLWAGGSSPRITSASTYGELFVTGWQTSEFLLGGVPVSASAAGPFVLRMSPGAPDELGCGYKSGEVMATLSGDALDQGLVGVEPVELVAGMTGVYMGGHAANGAIVVARLDPKTLTVTAVRTFASNGEARVTGLDVSPQGDVVLGGTFNGMLKLGDGQTNLTSAGDDLFIARLDPQTLVPVRGIKRGGAGDQALHDLEFLYTDPQDLTRPTGVAITGVFVDQLSLGGAEFVLEAETPQTQHTFVAAYTIEGNDFVTQWARDFKNEGAALEHQLAVDSGANVYLVGDYEQLGPFDPAGDGVGIGEPGTHSVFALRLDQSGALVWARSFGDVEPTALDVDVDLGHGGVLVSGDYDGSLRFESDAGPVLQESELRDIFLIRLRAGDGIADWSERFGDVDGGAPQLFRALSAADDGSALLVGEFWSSVDLGSAQLETESGGLSFLARLSG